MTLSRSDPNSALKASASSQRPQASCVFSECPLGQLELLEASARGTGATRRDPKGMKLALALGSRRETAVLETPEKEEF